MVGQTRKESDILLKLFKDFSKNYNSNSISKEVNISPRGALKILKKLEKDKILVGRKLGQATFYKLNLNDLYARRVMEVLLTKEARDKAQRWISEFKEVFSYADIVIIFGSMIKNPAHASDIDLLLVFKRRKYKEVSDFINDKNKILLKKIHDIPQTMQDLTENLKKNPAIIDAIRTGYVLHGFNELVEVIKNVTVI
ncbi:MAG: ArsR family transcriptional regulator [Nanoarchaeota archaeon]